MKIELVLLCLITIRIYAQEKPDFVSQTGHSHVVKSVSFSPDSKYVLSGSADATLKKWEISTLGIGFTHHLTLF